MCVCVCVLYAPVLYHAGMNEWTFQLEWKNWNKTKRKEIICSMSCFNIGQYALHLYSMFYVLSEPTVRDTVTYIYNIMPCIALRATPNTTLLHYITPFPLHVYIIFIHVIFSLPSVCCIDSYNQKEKISFILPSLHSPNSCFGPDLPHNNDHFVILSSHIEKQTETHS